LYKKEIIKMVNKKSWGEFRETGLLLIINQILHIFGWAIVVEMENDKVTGVYPARVKFRGFGEASVDKAYKKVSAYMKENASVLYDEAQLEDKEMKKQKFTDFYDACGGCITTLFSSFTKQFLEIRDF